MEWRNRSNLFCRSNRCKWTQRKRLSMTAGSRISMVSISISPRATMVQRVYGGGLGIRSASTYRGSFQSSSAGQSSLPHASLVNPRECLSSRSTGESSLNSRLTHSDKTLELRRVVTSSTTSPFSKLANEGSGRQDSRRRGLKA